MKPRQILRGQGISVQDGIDAGWLEERRSTHQEENTGEY